ncbi:glycosyltransferase [Rhodobacterales bacterium HKCCSP123]|nr:glycosyltransferase [Rhodobacterales bacterium HKCCSP123]
MRRAMRELGEYVPTVSIVTPAYNAEHVIGEAAASIAAQDLEDWEWIVVDDGSSDGTADRIKAIHDDRVTLIRQENRGVSAARNAALDVVRGNYVTFLDADDRLPQGSLSRRVAFLEEHPDVDILNGGIERVGQTRDLKRYRPSTDAGPLFPRIAQLDEGVFFGPFYMMRRSVIGDHRFPEGVTHCEDLIFFTELAHERDLTYAGIEDIVYEYRVSPGSAMSDLDGIEAGYLEYLRRVLLLERMTPAMRSDLRRRIASIMAKSWLRRGRPARALAAAAQMLRA